MPSLADLIKAYEIVETALRALARNRLQSV
jgi:hypothetical protein